MRTSGWILLAGVILLLVQCATVPVTGRKQLLIMPESEMMAMSLTSYNDFLKENKLSANAIAVRQVKEVGETIFVIIG